MLLSAPAGAMAPEREKEAKSLRLITCCCSDELGSQVITTRDRGQTPQWTDQPAPGRRRPAGTAWPGLQLLTSSPPPPALF